MSKRRGTQKVSFGAPLKAFLIGVTLALSLLSARPSHAMEFFIDYASMDLSRTGVIKKNGQTVINAYMAPVLFNAFYGTGSTPATGAWSGPIDLVAWCVDIFHPFTLGDVNLHYSDNYQLASNSNYMGNAAHAFEGGTALTDAQLMQVGALVHYGTQVYNMAAASIDKINQLAGLQGAIWQVINKPGGYTVESSNGNAAIRNSVNSYIGQFAGLNYLDFIGAYGPVGRNVRFLTEDGKYGTKNAHQSFAVVPEPATWAMLIIGFGGLGLVLRRRRLNVAVGAA